ncbi:MAG: hypothetical protein LBF41_05615 [Deltaproteobacteria bacterium]|nr:hypothetical protein [Deltaproteobacteria bacterium]
MDEIHYYQIHYPLVLANVRTSPEVPIEVSTVIFRTQVDWMDAYKAAPEKWEITPDLKTGEEALDFLLDLETDYRNAVILSRAGCKSIELADSLRDWAASLDGEPTLREVLERLGFGLKTRADVLEHMRKRAV